MIKFSKYLLFTAILLTPVYNISFHLALMSIEIPRLVYLKAIKDLSICLLILSMVIRFLGGHAINKKLAFYYTVLGTLFILTFIKSYYTLEGRLLFILGYRVFLPFLLLGFGFYFWDHNDVKRLNFILNILFALLIISSFIFLFLFPKRFGLNFMGFSRRLSGFFFHPLAAGLFLVFFATFKKIVYRTNKFYWIILPFLFLVNSLTGLALWLSSFILSNIKRSAHLLVYPILAFAVVILLSLYPTISGRTNFYSGLYGRMEGFYKAVSNGGVFGNFVGYGNNFFLTLKRRNVFDVNIEDLFISDNEYTSLIGQTGFLGCLFYIFFILYFLLKGNKGQYLLVILVSIAGVGIIWHESFPINFLIPLLIGYFEKVKRVYRRYETSVIQDCVYGSA